ncbi:AraC family transcriptional regulator [Vibrio rotiferianus]|uniref:helix-turn-helix domain-containing protein n=1 Tax=Vibrio rotiferianus TaxID=190895 RepID=UPI00406A0DEC
MLRTITQLWLGILLSFPVLALDSASAIFYPLPTQIKGTFIAAQHLFPGEQGGLWIHDVHGRVLFYDGSNLQPKSGSLLDFSVDQVAYIDGAFWTFFNNEVYRTKPNQERKLIFSLNPGAQIRKIGASGDYIWVSDGSQFHTYHVAQNKLEAYSLLQLYQHSNNSHVYINDAIFVKTRWVLATNSGAYLSEGKRFNHVVSSKKHFIEKVYYSASRREIVIGSLKGALVFSLENAEQPIVRIGDSHVLAIAETNQEYWIGTEHGLFVHSFLSGETSKVTAASFQELDLSQSKIYSLLNDNMGGMWVATNRGIRYYSMFSKKFERMTFDGGHRIADLNKITQTYTGPKDQLWLSSGRNVYLRSNDRTKLIIQAQNEITQFAIREKQIWIATNDGLQVYDLSTQQWVELPYLRALAGAPIEHIINTDEGKIWLARGKSLFYIDPSKQLLRNLGDDWLVAKYLPAKITRLFASSSELIIGTDHGYYQYDGEKIRFNHFSASYGEVLDIVESTDGAYWFASAYGVFKTQLRSNEQVSMALRIDNARPACMLADSEGVWLSSSVGLSYYRLSGELVKHYSSASGLINNEFTSGVCNQLSHPESNHKTLVFGSKYGLVKADSTTLLVSKSPESKVIISRVSSESGVIQVGGGELNDTYIPYGSSVSFLFGVMPKPNTQVLHFRLNTYDEWQVLEGGQLNLEHLSSGHYTLQVSSGEQVIRGQVGAEFQFTVLEPWYRTSFAIFSFVMTLLFVFGAVGYWRSRYVLQHNKELAAQVTLKTNQLRHQSRVLLSSNQQLRKQIQVRNLLVDHVASSIKTSIDVFAKFVPDDCDESTQDHLKKAYWQLNELKVVPVENTGNAQSYDLNQITSSVIDVWREDFKKAGLELEFQDVESHSRVVLESFNLDVIFNTVFANIIKRSYRGQSVRVSIGEDERHITLTMLDFGNQLPSKLTFGKPISMNQVDLSIEQLSTLVEASGGKLSIISSDTQNKFDITWPKVHFTDEQLEHVMMNSFDDVLEPTRQEPVKMSPEQEWLNKVYQLVSDNFSDAEFGTASAAKLLFMSERSLQRRFKSASSRTFKDYLTEVRLETACEQLLAGEKISEVAFNCGFNDPSYFSQKFRLHFGLPPSKFATTQESQTSL